MPTMTARAIAPLVLLCALLPVTFKLLLRHHPCILLSWLGAVGKEMAVGEIGEETGGRGDWRGDVLVICSRWSCRLGQM
jgi:hypothetical protein